MTVKDNEKDIQILKDITRKLSGILIGNGERGMDEIVRDIEKRVGVLESEFKHMKRVLFEQAGLDALGNPKKEDKIPERIWFIDKVLPGLVQSVILFVAGILLTLVALQIQAWIPK